MLKVITGIKLIFNILTKRENAEWARFFLAEKISQMIYPKYKFSEFGRLVLEDNEFIQYYESVVSNGNYHSFDRKYTLDQLMKLVISVEGDTAECGALRGASSYLICRHIMGLQKRHHIFDSFEGLSVPDSKDGNYWKKGDLAVSETVIRRNLKEFDFVVYHKGWIPKKFHEVSDLKFCFVHVDVDLYQPTLDSLAFFYPKMGSGGVILCDDYGFVTCPGAKKAFDEYMEDKPEEIIHIPTGQCLVIRK